MLAAEALSLLGAKIDPADGCLSPAYWFLGGGSGFLERGAIARQLTAKAAICCIVCVQRIEGQG